MSTLFQLQSEALWRPTPSNTSYPNIFQTEGVLFCFSCKARRRVKARSIRRTRSGHSRAVSNASGGVGPNPPPGYDSNAVQTIPNPANDTLSINSDVDDGDNWRREATRRAEMRFWALNDLLWTLEETGRDYLEESRVLKNSKGKASWIWRKKQEVCNGGI